MTIPTYKDIMLPFLRSLSDGKVHSLKELYQVLPDQMQLDEEARSQLLPSGSQSIFYNRVGWDRTYFNKALLIGAVASGQFRITDRGLALLKQQPKHMLNNQYFEFRAFKQSFRPKEEFEINNKDIRRRYRPHVLYV